MRHTFFLFFMLVLFGCNEAEDTTVPNDKGVATRAEIPRIEGRTILGNKIIPYEYNDRITTTRWTFTITDKDLRAAGREPK